MRTSADEERSPKYCHVERERRFLVDPAMLPPLDGLPVLIEDRYIVGTRFRLRRMTDEGSGVVALKLAKKYEASKATARPMVNAYLTIDEFALFYGLPATTIVKRRYDLQVGNKLFGIDRFEGALAGLMLAEVDAADDASLAAIDRPYWAICDVSYDPAFQGGALTRLDAPGLVELLQRMHRR